MARTPTFGRRHKDLRARFDMSAAIYLPGPRRFRVHGTVTDGPKDAIGRQVVIELSIRQTRDLVAGATRFFERGDEDSVAVMRVTGFTTTAAGVCAVMHLVDDQGRDVYLVTPDDVRAALAEEESTTPGSHPAIGREARIFYDGRIAAGEYIAGARWDGWVRR